MIESRKFLRVAGLALALLAPGAPAWAGEHPEHPNEHPDGKTSAGKNTGAACSMEDVASAAEKWATRVEAGGSLKIYDKVQKKTLNLAYMQVHRERLSKVGKDRYFVCADFKDTDGTVYDVDLFMKGTDKDNLKADGKPSIHKVNGVARYTWMEKKGVWKQVATKK